MTNINYKEEGKLNHLKEVEINDIFAPLADFNVEKFADGSKPLQYTHDNFVVDVYYLNDKEWNPFDEIVVRISDSRTITEGEYKGCLEPNVIRAYTDCIYKAIYWAESVINISLGNIHFDTIEFLFEKVFRFVERES